MTTTAPTEPPTSPARTRRRGWPFWVGVGLVLAGLSLLGWIGWQTYGTNIVSNRKHTEIVQKLEQQWKADGTTGSGSEGPSDTVRVEAGDASAIMRVPRFGADFRVPVLEGVSDEVLAAGMGHFEGTAGPGQVGNYALAGHRITHGEPLRGMPELQVGDQIQIETRSMIYTYELDTGGDDLTVPFTAGWVVGKRPVNPDGGVGPDPTQKRLITLTTCSELFHTDNRSIAFGHLVTAQPK